MGASELAVIFASYLPVLGYMITLERRLAKIETLLEVSKP